MSTSPLVALVHSTPLVALVHPSTSPLVMMVLLPLPSIATAVLAAPSPMADYVYDGSDAEFEVSGFKSAACPAMTSVFVC